MKIRNYLVFLLAIILAGCSNEEDFGDLEEVNSGVSITAVFQCDPDWEAPDAIPGDIGDIIHITYDQNLTLEEVNCIRQEYFGQFECLRMALIQPSNPHYDVWLAIRACGPPGSDGNNTVTSAKNEAENDPQVCAAPPNECHSNQD